MNKKIIIICIYFVLNFFQINMVWCMRTNRKPGCNKPILKNGLIKSNGRLLKFKCLRGYKMFGHSYAKCMQSRWDNPVPVCAKSGCKMPPAPENGFIVDNAQGASITYYCKQNYQIAGSSFAFCDGRNWDRSLGTCRETNIGPATWCDFEVSDLCGWTHDEVHDFEWKRMLAMGSNRLVRTGPQYDHTNYIAYEGHYILLESLGQFEDDIARLMSPVYPAELSVNACVRFYYFMYGTSVGRLRIYLKPVSVNIRTMTTETRYVLFEKSGNQRNAWQEAYFTIDQLTESFQIVIEGTVGTTSLSDIAIDDIALIQDEECVADFYSATESEMEETGNVFYVQSCKDRCNETESQAKQKYETILNGTGQGGVIMNCDCQSECINLLTCCPDYPRHCIPDFNEMEVTSITPTIPSSTVSSTIQDTNIPPTAISSITELFDKRVSKADDVTPYIIAETTKVATTPKILPKLLTKTTIITPPTTKLVLFNTTSNTTTSTPHPPITTTTSTTATTTTARPQPKTTSKKLVTIVIPRNTTTIPSKKTQSTTTIKPTIKARTLKTTITTRIKIPPTTKKTPLKTTPKLFIKWFTNTTTKIIPTTKTPIVLKPRMQPNTTTLLPSTTNTAKRTTTTSAPTNSTKILPNKYHQTTGDVLLPPLENENEMLRNTKFTKQNNNKTTENSFTPQNEMVNNEKFSVIVIVLINAVIFVTLFTVCAIVYYRRNCGAENYKKNAEQVNRSGEDNFSEVRYLTSDEELDFTLQTAITNL